MSADAIYATTEALRTRLEQVAGANQVHVGPPIRTEVADRRVALFLFNIVPNADLRNVERTRPPPPGAGASAAPVTVEALPLDLRYLISVFRAASSTDHGELTVLGQIVQTLHANPVLSGAALPGQTVRLTPEPYTIEELNRVWGLFPEDAYRTSIAYLATPVFVELPPSFGPPVQSRTLSQGVSTVPPGGLAAAQEGAP